MILCRLFCWVDLWLLLVSSWSSSFCLVCSGWFIIVTVMFCEGPDFVMDCKSFISKMCAAHVSDEEMVGIFDVLDIFEGPTEVLHHVKPLKDKGNTLFRNANAASRKCYEEAVKRFSCFHRKHCCLCFKRAGFSLKLCSMLTCLGVRPYQCKIHIQKSNCS